MCFPNGEGSIFLVSCFFFFLRPLKIRCFCRSVLVDQLLKEDLLGVTSEAESGR